MNDADLAYAHWHRLAEIHRRKRQKALEDRLLAKVLKEFYSVDDYNAGMFACATNGASTSLGKPLTLEAILQAKEDFDYGCCEPSFLRDFDAWWLWRTCRAMNWPIKEYRLRLIKLRADVELKKSADEFLEKCRRERASGITIQHRYDFGLTPERRNSILTHAWA